MDFKMKQKPQTANPAAAKTPPYVIPEAEAPTISRAKLEIDIIRDYANRGKVKQAVARIQRLPPEQRDLVVGLLSVLPQILPQPLGLYAWEHAKGRWGVLLWQRADLGHGAQQYAGLSCGARATRKHLTQHA